MLMMFEDLRATESKELNVSRLETALEVLLVLVDSEVHGPDVNIPRAGVAARRVLNAARVRVVRLRLLHDGRISSLIRWNALLCARRSPKVASLVMRLQKGIKKEEGRRKRQER